MGGLGPGIGGLEILVIALLALIVVGPKDLPLMLRKVGRAVAKARAMANEFRASFDEMARQSELDELRKEVEALRRGQGMLPLGAEAEAAFRDIQTDLENPVTTPALPAPQPDSAQVVTDPTPPPAAEIAETPAKPRKAPARKAAAKPRAKVEATEPKPAAKPKAKRKAAPAQANTGKAAPGKAASTS